jgi:LmbE family N-acetylglucosaminyl deacetylase
MGSPNGEASPVQLQAPPDGFDVAVPSRVDPAGWAAALAERPVVPLPHADRVTVLAAHPDDETLAVGGVVAGFAARGSAVSVVIATDGAASHPGHPDRPGLVATRRTEAEAAIAALGDGRIALRWWDLPDGGLSGAGDELRDRLTAEVGRTDLLLAPWAFDGHADHDALGRAAAEAVARHPCRLWWYPLWAWHWSEARGPLVEATLRLRLHDDARARKARALACYRSQLEPDGAAPVVPPHVVAHFLHPWEAVVPA